MSHRRKSLRTQARDELAVRRRHIGLSTARPLGIAPKDDLFYIERHGRRPAPRRKT